MTLNELLATAGVTSERVQAHLASLSGEERVRQATRLDRQHHKTLWDLSAATEPLRLEEEQLRHPAVELGWPKSTQPVGACHHPAGPRRRQLRSRR